MRGVKIYLAAAVLVASSLMFPAQKDIKVLPPQFQQWLEEVGYIISPVEKDVFLQLDSDRERDLFIDAFWKNRDSVPVTDRNEFKEEHYRRIEYANRNYGRLSSAPGWKTDMGRIYIILGPSISIQRFEDSSFAYPAIVWSYQGMAEYGLPDQFNVVFYKKHGIGDYRIYSPIMDGPQSLLAMVGVDQSDPFSAYRALYAQSPQLAQFTLSLIPGEALSEGQPSMESEQLLLNIANAPFKLITDDYARNLLRFKSTVGVEYSANYIGNNSCVQAIRDESGMAFVHYLIELDKFSVERYDDEYITKLLLNGKVSDLEGRTIFQYERAIPVKLDQKQLKEIGAQKYALGDIFPLAEGSYQLNILVKNDASKEFTSMETNISIPDVSSPQISPLLLAYKTEEDPSNKIKAFKVGNRQLYPALRHDFATKDNMIVFFQIFGMGSELRQRGSLRYIITSDSTNIKAVDKDIKSYPNGYSFLEELPLSGVSPGYYKIKISLMDEAKREILSAESDFSVSQIPALPRPWISLGVHAPAEDPAYISILADQLFKKGNIERARTLAEKAYRLNPGSPQLAVSYGMILFAEKSYRTVIEILTPFLASKNYEGLELLGRSSQALGEFGKAISYYLEYLSHYGDSFYILTFLGECYYQTGNAQEALRVWEKSLELNPNQEEIRKAVDMLRKK